MKPTFFLVLSIMANMAFALEPNSIGLTTETVNRPKNMKGNHLICLGSNWENVDERIHARIQDLKDDFPKLLKNIDSKQQNCFAVERLPKEAGVDVDKILKMIDNLAGDQLYKTSSNPETKKESEPSFRNEDAGLLKKLGRGQLLLTGVQAIGLGSLVLAPRSITEWEEGWTKNIPSNLQRAWTTKPVIDKDHWPVNYIVHPMAGAIYYNALRSQGASRLESFIYSTVQSTLWEYGVEAIAEQPSIQDLILTPVVGSVMGELAHQATLRMKKNGFTTSEKVLVTIINPMFVLNNGYGTQKK